jgi:hypothetical protein
MGAIQSDTNELFGFSALELDMDIFGGLGDWDFRQQL